MTEQTLQGLQSCRSAAQTKQSNQVTKQRPLAIAEEKPRSGLELAVWHTLDRASGGGQRYCTTRKIHRYATDMTTDTGAASAKDTRNLHAENEKEK